MTVEVFSETDDEFDGAERNEENSSDDDDEMEDEEGDSNLSAKKSELSLPTTSMKKKQKKFRPITSSSSSNGNRKVPVARVIAHQSGPNMNKIKLRLSSTQISNLRHSDSIKKAAGQAQRVAKERAEKERLGAANNTNKMEGVTLTSHSANSNGGTTTTASATSDSSASSLKRSLSSSSSTSSALGRSDEKRRKIDDGADVEGEKKPKIILKLPSLSSSKEVIANKNAATSSTGAPKLKLSFSFSSSSPSSSNSSSSVSFSSSTESSSVSQINNNVSSGANLENVPASGTTSDSLTSPVQSNKIDSSSAPSPMETETLPFSSTLPTVPQIEQIAQTSTPAAIQPSATATVASASQSTSASSVSSSPQNVDNSSVTPSPSAASTVAPATVVAGVGSEAEEKKLEEKVSGKEKGSDTTKEDKSSSAAEEATSADIEQVAKKSLGKEEIMKLEVERDEMKAKLNAKKEELEKKQKEIEKKQNPVIKRRLQQQIVTVQNAVKQQEKELEALEAKLAEVL